MTTRKLCVLIAVLGCFLLAPVDAWAQGSQSNLTVTYPAGFAVSTPESQIQQAAPAAIFPNAQRIIPLGRLPMPSAGVLAPNLLDPALQTSPGPLLELDDDGGKARFPGMGADGYAPPDPNLAVGPNHIVQIVNVEFSVYDKSGTIFAGYPKTIGSLFGSLGNCWYNWGDPIVQYDRPADRWVITQLGNSPNNNAPYSECFAVSQTNDPTGAYYLYYYNFDYFNDYPKIGVWPTATNSAYTATYNLFTKSGFYGAELCAYDRSAMLSGAANPASICSPPILNDGGFLPSDLDGSTPPPTGSPGYFLNFQAQTQSSLRLYQLAPNFANPSSSTLSAPMDIAVEHFYPACAGGTCIPQPGTSYLLDSLGDRLMYRLAYRNFGDHDTLVVNHSVATASAAAGGVRWYELRSPLTGVFTLFQQGTYAPDSTYRWMGSAAMDQAGDIAIGYSASSSSVFPAIRYTGRTPSDPPGTMRTETSLHEGAGSQNIDLLSRWGDYTALRIDPSDDCTFWYTNQYQPSNGAYNWATFVGSFKFSNCGAPPAQNFSISTNPTSLTLTQGNQGTSTVTVTSQNGFNSAVSLTVSGCPTGASCSFNPTSVTPPSNGSVTSILTVNAGTATPNTYTLTITGTSGSLTHFTNVTLTVTAPNFSISTNPTSLTLTQGNQGTSTVTVTSQNGFNSAVSLAVSGCPTGASCSFNPASVTPPSNGSATSILAVNAGTATPNTYMLTITGNSGSLSHSTNVTLVVNGGASPDFSISATSLTLTQGASGNSTVTVTSLNGFNNSVSLTVSNCPANTTCSLQPVSVTPTANSTLTVSTTASTSTGTFTLTVTGTSGTRVHSTSVTLTVNPAAAPDFSLSRSPRSLTLTQGSSGTSTITVTALNGFTGNVALTITGCPSGATGATCSLSTSSVTPTATSTLTVSTTASTSTGIFTLTITGSSGSLVHTTRVTLTVNPNADFTISASPSLLNVNRSSSGTYNVTIGNVYGGGTVNLRVSGLPSQTSASFSPNPAGNPGSSTLTVNAGSGAASGTNATLTIRGSNGTFSHSTTVTLHIN